MFKKKSKKCHFLGKKDGMLTSQKVTHNALLLLAWLERAFEAPASEIMKSKLVSVQIHLLHVTVCCYVVVSQGSFLCSILHAGVVAA